MIQAIAYVSKTEGGEWIISDSRVTLASVVYPYLEGCSVEEINVMFPSLKLEQIHGAVAFYLRNRAEIDCMLAAERAEWQRLRVKSEHDNADLLQRLRTQRMKSAAGAT